MFRLLMLLFAFASLAFAPLPFPKPRPAATDLDALQGEWQRVRVTVNGTVYDESKAPTTIVIEGGRMKYAVSGKPTNEWEFTLAPKEGPKQFDRKGTRGAALRLVYLGVYRIEKDTFILCSCPGTRPTNFDGVGIGVYLETFTRKKK
jgi:uncharacterized protein (TIGR03067 family)